MMSLIASAPFFTLNFSRFQDDFLRVYLYFILERLIFTLKVPLVTEIFYYQRLMFEFARNVRTWPSPGQKKLSISTTPTMTKNRRLCCRRRPIFNAPSPTNQGQHPSRPWCGDFAPCLSPEASLRVSVSHRSISREAGWSTSHFLLRMPPPKLQTRRHSSLRSISIVLSCGGDGKVSNLFLRRRISIETHLLVY